MPTSNDRASVAELHFPVSVPLSLLGRLFLPKEWRFSSDLMEPELPHDPIAFFDDVITKLEEEVTARLKGSSQPGGSAGELSITQSDLVEFAIQTWRLHRRVEGMDPQKHEREYKQFADSVRRFVKFLERFEVVFEDPVGKPYTTGWLEVEVISWDEQGEDVSPVTSGAWVKQTVSPIVRHKGKTIKVGEVICVEREK